MKKSKGTCSAEMAAIRGGCAVLIAACAAMGSPLMREGDSQWAVFPSPATPEYSASARSLLGGLAALMEKALPSSDVVQRLAKSDAQAVQARIELLKSHGDPAVRREAARREWAWRWATGAVSAEEASGALAVMAGGMDSRERSTTLAVAATIAARSGDVAGAIETLRQTDAAATPQFGWYAFEFAKYAGEYVHAHVTPEQRLEGSPDPKEHANGLRVAASFREWLLPAMEANVGVMRDMAAIEQQQMLAAFECIAEQSANVLGRPMYEDVAMQAAEMILPRVIAAWKQALAQAELDDTDRAAQHRLIARFETESLPRLKRVQQFQQLRHRFGSAAFSAEKELDKTISRMTGAGEVAPRAVVPVSPAAVSEASDERSGAPHSTVANSKLLTSVAIGVLVSLAVVGWRRRRLRS